MDSLGMAPFKLESGEDIFDSRQKPLKFEETLRLATNQVFSTGSKGFSLRGTPSGLGREVRNPLDSLTLIYVWAEQRSSYVRDFSGPVLAVNVFERSAETGNELEDMSVIGRSGVEIHRRTLSKVLKQGEGFCRITYVAPLQNIIQDTREATVQSIVEMLSVVRSDFWPSS